jgi:hypothetical protein
MHSRSLASLPAAVATGTQDLVLEEVDINDQHLMKRKRVASNATSRKVPPTTDKLEGAANITAVESSAVVDVRLEGQKQHKRQVVLAYLDSPVHQESLLANEHMSSEYFVLQPRIHDNHLLSRAEKDMCIDSVARLKFIYLHRHFFHRIYSSDEALLLAQDYHSDKHVFLVIMGGALTNS